MSWKDRGKDVVEKLMSPYPALPVVNDKLEVVGIVSDYDVFDALKEGRTIYEFSAESIMTCGRTKGASECDSPLTVTPDTPIDDIVNMMHEEDFSILPVVESKKNRRLAGLISRKNIINALAEEGFWPEHQFQKRVKAV